MCFQLDEVCGDDMYNLEGTTGLSTSWLNQLDMYLIFRTDSFPQGKYKGFIVRVERKYFYYF